MKILFLSFSFHPEELSRFSVMMYWIELLTLALWLDEFHALATYSQRELPTIPTRQEGGWIQRWYR